MVHHEEISYALRLGLETSWLFQILVIIIEVDQFCEVADTRRILKKSCIVSIELNLEETWINP